MALSKQDALKIIFLSAETYEKELANNNILFVSQDKHRRLDFYEVTFERNNFLHLTGVKLVSDEVTASVFYQRCLAKRLSIKDFKFATDGTSELKLKVLPTIMSKNLSAKMIGEFESRRVKLFSEKVAGGVRACIGFVLDKKGTKHVPNTLLNQDIRDLTRKPNRIIITYRKAISDVKYSEIVYAAKKVEWDKLNIPEQYRDLPFPK